MSEYEVEYAQLQAMLGDPDQRGAAVERVLEMISPLIRTYLWERHGSLLRGLDAAHDAHSDGVIAVMGMLQSFDPQVGSLYHYLTARNAAWRRAVDASVRNTDHAVKFSDGERRVLALAYKLRSEYLSENPDVALSHETWLELVRNHVLREEEGDEERATYNTRKGITAAVRNLPELLAASQTPLHPDADPSMWSYLEPESNPVGGSESIFALVGVDIEHLTGAQTKKAAARVASGHGQFAYLSGCEIVNSPVA